jgi:hypothetical protein
VKERLKGDTMAVIDSVMNVVMRTKMTKKTMMRVSKELLDELKKLKRFDKESYADTVKGLIEERRRKKK